MYLLDYILPQVAKLSRALQTKHVDLSLISSLVDATLNSLDDAILPSANMVLQLQDAREELKAATSIEVTLSDSSKIIYPAGLDPPQKMCYQPSVFLIQRKCPASQLMSYLYMETVQFKLSLESLGEIYQLNHWKELNFRRQPFSLLTSVQSGKRIVSSLLSSQKMIYPCN